jgi:hypothetical protein
MDGSAGVGSPKGHIVLTIQMISTHYDTNKTRETRLLLLLLLFLMMMMMIVIFMEECPLSVILMTYGSDGKQQSPAWPGSQEQVYEAGK